MHAPVFAKLYIAVYVCNPGAFYLHLLLNFSR
jgi:hypothetical protein